MHWGYSVWAAPFLYCRQTAVGNFYSGDQFNAVFLRRITKHLFKLSSELCGRLKPMSAGDDLNTAAEIGKIPKGMLQANLHLVLMNRLTRNDLEELLDKFDVHFHFVGQVIRRDRFAVMIMEISDGLLRPFPFIGGVSSSDRHKWCLYF
jgi:hypothetical protein